MSDVTVILNAIDRGEARSDELLPLVYDELRRLAAAQMNHERPGPTLQATALVHEAFLRLVGEREPTWENRRHFFGAAAQAMRRILVEQARRKRRLKHGGELQQAELSNLDIVAADEAIADEKMLALDEALRKLEQTDPPKAELVRLRYFAGLSEQEAAAALNISRATASRWWQFSRAWLFERMQRE